MLEQEDKLDPIKNLPKCQMWNSKNYNYAKLKQLLIKWLTMMKLPPMI